MIESVSRRAFSSTSGTYNVRASELARDRKLNIFSVTVQFLDETEHPFHIEKKAKGNVLLEQVYTHLELVEKDYFGLQFTESGLPPNSLNSDTTRWLDGSKSVKKQVGVNAQLWLSVRFYPPEPSRLAEEYTRYLLCLQIRKLLLDGRISAPKNTALLLASFTIQAELGDFNESEHPQNYLSELCLLPKQTAEDERKIRELHKLHNGQSPADAEANFLEHAKRLDCYGVESHPAKDYNGKDILIGVTSIGIVVFQNNIRINTFSWGKIVKISFKKKRFFIQLKREAVSGVERFQPPRMSRQDTHDSVYRLRSYLDSLLPSRGSENYDTVLGFNMRSSRAAKALWRCSVERHGFFRLRGPKRRPLLGALGALAGISQPVVLRTESQAIHASKRSRTSNRSFVRRSSSRHRSQSAGTTSPNSNGAALACRTSRVTSHTDPAPKHAWTDVHSQPDLNNADLLSRVLGIPLTYVDESESPSEHEDAVCIHLSADSEGVFGFNVRGGGGAPVLVSRVAARTREQLQQGDQVLSINGTDVEELTHEQIVQLIRSTKGVLSLIVKPNAIYETHNQETVIEEPESLFAPFQRSGDSEGDALEQSMLLLGDGLANGAALKQYDTLQRRIPEESTALSKVPKNVNKNRYRDIAPYDSTIVVLKNGQNGDYINASYINMEIPKDLVLSYIATQGPLSSTVGDFWQMVWESESTLVVMLTVLTETGRAKCHQYWPKVGASPLKATNSLTVTTNSEQNYGHYVQRDMVLKESTGACRNITQLQYTAWPDHGVPEDTSEFINFTQLCARLRNRRDLIPTVVEEDSEPSDSILADPPMVVHCSAGVGRTGVLILAETALEMLARRQPIFPLDLVRAMRRQRPMCIQNASQYKFVCESIQSAYAQMKQENSSDASSK